MAIPPSADWCVANKHTRGAQHAHTCVRRAAGGPLIFTVRQCINLHKLLVVPIYPSILYAYGGPDPFSFTQPYGPCAVLLLVCHGFYGLAWVFKDIYFPDKTWQVPM